MKAKLLSVIFPALVMTGYTSLAQNKTPDACSLISDKQVSSTLGVKVTKDTKESDHDRCTYRDNNPSHPLSFKVSYFDYTKEKNANEMLKMMSKSKSDDVNRGKNGSGQFSEYHTFPAGGANSFYVAGSGDFGKMVDLEFPVGSLVVTVETWGIDTKKVIAKLPDIYKIIKGNFH